MTKIFRALPLTAFLFSGCNCDPVVTEVPGDLKGKVCTPDGDPLVGASITVTGRTDRESVSDGNGEYTFTGLPPGAYDVTATLGDVVRQFPANEIVSDDVVFITDTACRPEPVPGETGVLDGQLCNRHTGELITEAEVLVQLADGGLMADSTDGEGRFSVSDVPTGQHIVSIRGDGYQRAFAIEILKDQTTTLDLADDCEGVNLGEGGIIGSFCDPETGGNLIGAAVTVRPVLGGPTEEEQHDITDIEGEFEINGLLPGNYDIEVRTGSYVFDKRDVPVIAGELTPITDTASCGGRPEVGRIEGQFCDAEAGGTFVGVVELKQGATIVDSTETAADGRFTFNGVTPGTYDLHAFRTSPDFERTFAGVVIVAFRPTIIDEGVCPELEDVCSEFENEPSITADGRILLVVDKSGSMGENFSGGGEKWDATRQALIGVTASLTSTVEFGLMLFPERDGDVCEDGSSVLVSMARNNANQIQSQLNATAPNGGTPTAPTLANARNVVAPLVADNRPIAVVLATDGGPNCNESLNNPSCICTDPGAPIGACPAINCLDNVNAYNQVTAIKNAGVNTFVVGITGAESFSAVLDEMAVRGGTARQGPIGSPKYYVADDPAALELALTEITRRVTACRITSPTNLTAVDSIEVSIGTTVIVQDNARQNGWAATASNTIELFGSACDLAVASLQNVKVKTCVSP